MRARVERRVKVGGLSVAEVVDADANAVVTFREVEAAEVVLFCERVDLAEVGGCAEAARVDLGGIAEWW